MIMLIIHFYEGKDTENEYDIDKYFFDGVDPGVILDYVGKIFKNVII